VLIEAISIKIYNDYVLICKLRVGGLSFCLIACQLLKQSLNLLKQTQDLIKQAQDLLWILWEVWRYSFQTNLYGDEPVRTVENLDKSG